MEYLVKLRMPMSNFSTGVKDLETELNGVLKDVGQKLSVTSVLPMTVTVYRPFTEEEMALYQKLLLESFATKFVGPITIESFTEK